MNIDARWALSVYPVLKVKKNGVKTSYKKDKQNNPILEL